MKAVLLIFLLSVSVSLFSQPSREEIKKYKIRFWEEKRDGEAGESKLTVWIDRKGNDSLQETSSGTTVIKNSYKNGRLVEKIFMSPEGKPGNKFTYQYHADGSYKETYTDAEFGMKSYQWFDKKGNLLKSQSPDGNTTTYKYNSKGKVISVTSDGANQGIKIDHKYFYNSKGQLIRLERNTDGNKTTITYLYDSKGKLVKQFEKGGWEGEEYESETLFEYNEKGLLAKSEMKNKSTSDPGKEAITTYKYEYRYY